MPTAYFNNRTASVERIRLAREIQKHDPSFILGPASHRIGVVNAEIESLRERLAEENGTLIRLSVPKSYAGPVATPAAKPSAWGHIHDLSLRALLERCQPGGPAQLAATAKTADAPAPKASQPQVSAIALAKKVLNHSCTNERDAVIELWKANLNFPGMDASAAAGHRRRENLSGCALAEREFRQEAINELVGSQPAPTTPFPGVTDPTLRAALTSLDDSVTRAEFNELSPVQQMKFCKAGGKISN